MSFMHSLNFYLKIKTGLGKSDRIYARDKQPQLGPAPLENLCSHSLNDLQGFCRP